MTLRPNLDFVRSYAVLLVLLDHTLLANRLVMLGRWQTEWIGQVGVLIFFVHTALVLMWSLERKPHVTEFYLRRVFRIYPLALVALWAAILTHAPVNGTPSDYFRHVPVTHRNILTASLLIQNLVYGQTNILSVLWSLPLEVQMYFLLPFLFFFVRQERSFWPLLALWGLICILCRQLFPPVSTALPMVLPCFLPGVMAYLGFSRWRPRLPAALLPLALFVLTTIFLIKPSLRSAWFFCLALGLLLPHFRDFRSVWICRVSHEVAKYSYGIYLAHPFSIVLGLYLLRGHSLWLQLGVELVSLCLLATAAYHWIEYPLIRVGSRVASRMEQRRGRKEAELLEQQLSSQG